MSSKRALSAIVSTILMVNIIIAMFVLIFAGFVPTISLTQSQANLWYNSQADSSRERLSIEMVVFNGTTASNKNITAFVRNVGPIDVKIIAAYVNGTLQNSVQPTLTGGYPIYVEAGSARYVAPFQIKYNWVGNVTYTVKLATARGNSDVSMAKAPPR